MSRSLRHSRILKGYISCQVHNCYRYTDFGCNFFPKQLRSLVGPQALPSDEEVAISSERSSTFHQGNSLAD
jgi:hypothetical protein